MDSITTSSNRSPDYPLSEEDALSRLRLIRSARVGPVTWHRLCATHGTACAALAALPEIAAQAGVHDYRPFGRADALTELRAARKAGLRPLWHGSADYPAELATLPDAPPLLWMTGNPAALLRPRVALVGTRNASSLGLRMAHRLARDLSDLGFTIVSGLARGIDTACHESALAGGTIAVLPGGVDAVYPQENRELAQRITDHGLLIGERPPAHPPRPADFIARNRLISGMASGLVVIEATARSGSLITARNALDQWREVMAVPGHPVDPRAAGCNLLLRDGAILVRDADDVIDALNLPGQRPRAPDKAAPTPRPPPAGPSAGATGPAMPPPPSATPGPAAFRDSFRDIGPRILEQLQGPPVPEDQLLQHLAHPLTTPALAWLELEGHIERLPGGQIGRARD